MPAFTPHYRRIMTNLVDLIREGKLPPGSKLPSTRELAEQQGASKTTVRLAVRMLIDQGWLTGHQGLGVYVADKPPL